MLSNLSTITKVIAMSEEYLEWDLEDRDARIESKELLEDQDDPTELLVSEME